MSDESAAIDDLNPYQRSNLSSVDIFPDSPENAKGNGMLVWRGE